MLGVVMGFGDSGLWGERELVLPAFCYDVSMIKRDGLPEGCEDAAIRLEYCRVDDGVFMRFGENHFPRIFPHEEAFS